MSPKSLLIAVTTAIVILTAADVTVRKMAANSVPRQVEHTILRAPSRIDYLGVGNSLVAAGMDPDSFEKVCESTGHPCTAINGGLGATGLIEHLALTKLALRGHSVETLVYGYFDHQLATDVAERN